MTRVYIIILNYKKWADVCDCLETVFRSGYDQFTVIVIDNDSRNDSLQHIMQWAEKPTALKKQVSSFTKTVISKPIRYEHYTADRFIADAVPNQLASLVFVQNDDNKGFAAGLNPVINRLKSEDAFIWLLNPDMTVTESALNELVTCATAGPAKSIWGSVIKSYEEPEKILMYAGGRISFNSATVNLIRNVKNVQELDYVFGGSLFTHAHHYDELGLLPEDYFLYWEETDWCYNAKQKGFLLSLCERSVCYDKISTSIGKSFLAHFYYTRNGLLFLSRYKKQKLNIALFFTLFRILKRILTGQPVRAKGVFLGMIAYLKGTKHENK